jgi:hypothetical protein
MNLQQLQHLLLLFCYQPTFSCLLFITIVIIIMSTPTNHTSITSFFNECEQPGNDAESQMMISLDSSIEESNIFEQSAHSRFSNLMNRSRAASGGQSLLGPLEEEDASEGGFLSNNSSDAENNFGASNAHSRVTITTPTSNADTNKQSVFSSNTYQSGGILKPSRFAAEPPPPPPPPRNLPHQSLAKAAVTPSQQSSSSHHKQRQEIPVLSVTTLLANAKSEETDSAFLNAFYNNNNNNKNNNNTTTTSPAPDLQDGAANNNNNNITTPLADPSQRTNATFGMIPGNVPSETIHTSNLRMTDRFTPHAQDRVAAWAIHIALIFFCGLVVASVLISFTVIHRYGFVALLGLCCMVFFVGFLAVFVDQTILSQNPKLRPIRQKIAAVVQATKGLLVEEYHLLIRDWNEHLLLTQGEEQHQAYTDNAQQRGSRLPPPSMPQGRKRSKIFKMVKPFLGLKKKLFGARRRRAPQPQPSFSGVVPVPESSKANNNTMDASRQQPQAPGYQPPDAASKATGVMA